MARGLGLLARLVCGYRRVVLFAELALFIAAVFYTIENLQFDTNRDNLVGANEKYQHAFLAYKQEFPQQDDLAVVVQSGDPERNRQFVERLGARVAAEGDIFTNLFYNNSPQSLGRKSLQLFPESDLADFQKSLTDFRPFIEKFAQTSNLVSFFDLVNTLFRTAPRQTNEQTESLIGALPALERIVTQADANMLRLGEPPSPGVAALFDPTGEAMERVYITYDKGRIFLLTAQPKTLPPSANPIETEKWQEDTNNAAVERLRVLVDQTKMEVPGVNATTTGMPVLDYDEMVQSQKDTTVASIVALVLCALIFVYGYQETGRPVKATLCLVVGLGYTLAFAALVIGHLNILTITFVPMLVGLAIDFGVHLITRYEEELRHGRTEEGALTKAMVFTGQGIFTGAFTTAGAFLAMGFTNFRGIQEMGIICGGGLLICFVPMMTLLPVLLMRGRQNVIDHQQGDLSETRARIENLWLKRPIFVVIVTAAICGLAATQIRKVSFDYNLLHMQSEGLPSVQAGEMLVHSAGQSLLFGAVIANSLGDAVKLEHEITNLPAVSTVESMAPYLVEDQTRKLRMIREIKRELSGLHFAEPDPRPVSVPELSRTLYSSYGYLGAAMDELGTNEPALGKQFRSLRDAIENLRKDMWRGEDDEIAAHAKKLGQFQVALYQDLRKTFQALEDQDVSSPLRAADLPPNLRNMFIGAHGKFLLQVYGKKDMWQRDNQKEFIDELRTVDPNVTGMPVQLYYYTELLKDSYVQAAWYSLAAIVVLVLFHFRSLLSLVLALLPVAIGSLWLGGWMGWLGIQLNPANIMTLPLVIGIGVTNGIHILNRFAEEQTAGILSRSTGKAVFVSGLTAIAGFGSLMLGKHRGIRSLGEVMSIGITTCMIAGLTFLPALLNLIVRVRSKRNQPSADNARSTLGREEPR